MAGRKGNSGSGQQIVGMALNDMDSPESVLPPIGTVLQAGAFGAAFSGVTTGIADGLKVRDGEMTRQQALHDVTKSSLQGAATMAAASSVAHVARTRPLIGVMILALAGLGYVMSGSKKTKPTPSHPQQQP